MTSSKSNLNSPKSIEELFRDTRPDLVQYAQRNWQLSQEDAEDLAHDALTQAWHKRNQFSDRGSGSYFGWVCQIMINRWKDNRKKKGLFLNRRAVSLDTETVGDNNLHSILIDPKSKTGYEEVEVKIDRGFLYRNARLSKQEEQVLHLADVEGLKPSEIAQKQQLKPDLVHKTLNRARQKMRKANPNYMVQDS